MAESLLALPRPPHVPARRDAVLLLRRTAPFSAEAVVFVAAAHGARGRALAREALRLLGARGGLRRILRPRRPLAPEAVARHLGVSGADLGRALARLDEALATGEVRGAARARTFLRENAPPGRGEPRRTPGSV
jgi:hypothetical protein